MRSELTSSVVLVYTDRVCSVARDTHEYVGTRHPNAGQNGRIERIVCLNTCKYGPCAMKCGENKQARVPSQTS